MYVCESCRRQVFPTDRVVQVVEQAEVLTYGMEEPQYLDGQNAFFHEEHWPGNSARFRELARGQTQDFVTSE